MQNETNVPSEENEMLSDLRSTTFGALAMTCMCIFFWIVTRIKTGQGNESYIALLGYYNAGIALYKAIRQKRRADLIFGLIWLLCAVCFTATYLYGLFA